MFAAVLADPAMAAGVRQRAERLGRFYTPLGIGAVSITEPVPGVVVGVAGRRPATLDASQGMLVWGEPLPSALASPPALIGAHDSTLRAISGMTAALAWDDGNVRLVTGSAGP